VGRNEEKTHRSVEKWYFRSLKFGRLRLLFYFTMYIAIPVWVKYKKGQTRRFAPTNNVLIAIGKRYKKGQSLNFQKNSVF